MNITLLNRSASCIVLAAALLAGSAQASVLQTNLLSHFDAGQGVYVNNPGASGDPGVLATNGQTVAEWHDLALDIVGLQVAAQTTAGARPTYITNAVNGLPAISFIDEDSRGLHAYGDGLDGGALITSGSPFDTNKLSWTLVFRQTNATNSGGALMASYNTSNVYFGTYHNSGSRRSVVRTDVPFGTGSNQNLANIDNDPIANQWIVLSVVWDGDAGVMREYVNGEETGFYAAINETAYESSTFNYLTIGHRTTGGAGNRLNGDIAELLIYGAALSDADRLANEQFLGAKYGIAVIPEPASLMLLTLGAAMMLHRRRRA